MDTIKITYGGETVRLTCNLSEASAPLKVDGVTTQYQTADARHRTAFAVLLAASVAWPGVQWPDCPRFGGDDVQDNEAWDELEYTTLSEQEVV